MSVNLRIIPRLDIRNNKLIKPYQFEGVKEIGNPITFAKKYFKNNADEILIMDVVASLYNRNNKIDIIKKISKEVSIPIIVGGGIRSLEDADNLFKNGADKIALNTAVLENPNLIKKLSNKYGSQSIVLSIEAKRNSKNNYWEALNNNGRDHTGYEIVEWAKKNIKLGIGEILLTSVDNDGTLKGLDINLIDYFLDKISIPTIVSGGMKDLEDINKIKNIKNLNAISVGSLLHYKKTNIMKIKFHAKKYQINVRMK